MLQHLTRRRAHNPAHFLEDFFRSMDQLATDGLVLGDVHEFSLDVTDQGTHLIVRADVPGIPKEDLTVTLENGLLTISGDRKQETETQGKNVYLCERTFGSFSRSFRVPFDVDAQSINATLKNGVLQLILERSPEATPRRIAIS